VPQGEIEREQMLHRQMQAHSDNAPVPREEYPVILDARSDPAGRMEKDPRRAAPVAQAAGNLDQARLPGLLPSLGQR
jgi:hypothetical protein